MSLSILGRKKSNLIFALPGRELFSTKSGPRIEIGEQTKVEIEPSNLTIEYRSQLRM